MLTGEMDEKVRSVYFLFCSSKKIRKQNEMAKKTTARHFVFSKIIPQK